MEQKQSLIRRVFEWLDRIHLFLWLFELTVAAGLAAVTYYSGLEDKIPVSALIMLCVFVFSYSVSAVDRIFIIFERKKANKKDYAYGLAYECIFHAFWPTNLLNFLQVGVQFRNASHYPITYYVEQFDVVLGNRTVAKPIFNSTGGLIPRGLNRIYRYPCFSSKDVEDFLDKETSGTIKFSVKYGHPDEGFSRRLTMEVHLTLNYNSSAVGLADSIIAESDGPL